MTVTLRIILLAASVICMTWILSSIRKSSMKIEDSVFWIIFSAALVVLSVFPQIIEAGAKVTGIQSSQNFLFLSVIFVLFIKIFNMSIKISKLEDKISSFAQKYTLDRQSDIASNEH